MVRAAVMDGPDMPVRLQEFPMPVPGYGEMVVSTIYSEVCGTDVHLWRGKLAGVPYPIIPGHISVGRVARVNGSIEDIDGNVIVEGDVVTFLDVHKTCYRCWHCLVAKASTRCPKRRVYGVTHSSNEGLFGGWSEAILLEADVKVTRLPAGITPLRLIAGGCALPTALHAIERAAVRIGDSVVVQGAGPVGLATAILARKSGAREVIIIDRSQARLDIARRFGIRPIAIHAGARSSDHIEIVLDATSGRGADVVIEATGAPAAVKEGIAMTRDAGRYVIVGHYANNGDISINPHLEINRKHLDIRGTWGIDFSHFYNMIEVLRHPLQEAGINAAWEDMVGRVYGLEQIEQALDDVERGLFVKAVIAPNGVQG